MIDLHTHILPGIDDGARDEEVSGKQLKSLSEQGVDTVVFTSHYYGRKRSPKQFLEARAAAFSRIKDLIPSDMETYFGAEVHFTGQMATANEALCSLAVGATRYLLAELPFTSAWDKALFRRLKEFISETDYVPVIAHVERYREVRKKPSLLAELKDMGCLLQANTGAFCDPRTKGLAFALLKHGFVDCLGTDTHNMDDRPPDYLSAKKAIEAEGLAESFERIQENMRLLLDDKPVITERRAPVKKLFGVYY